MKPLVGLSLMHEADYLQASLPLFTSNQVDVLEWSFDTIQIERAKPKWLKALLTEFSDNKRLIGHGVGYSVFDAKFGNRQQTWLKNLKLEVNKYNYSHITEHFGFMSNPNFHKGAPLPVPLTKGFLDIGINRLKLLQQSALLPIGIENLAFSFSPEQVKQQGEFIAKLIKPIHGFIILDLHNIYCQAQNFNLQLIDIAKMYPLDKVFEIHISGGSWQKSISTKEIKRVRRDTHDDSVPKEIFEFLPIILNLCKNLKYVIFERLGNTLDSKKEIIQFRKDFLKIKRIVYNTKFTVSNISEYRKVKKNNIKPKNNSKLYKQQQFILKKILNSKNPYSTLHSLNTQELINWDVGNWNPSMVETARELIKKWG